MTSRFDRIRLEARWPTRHSHTSCRLFSRIFLSLTLLFVAALAVLLPFRPARAEDVGALLHKLQSTLHQIDRATKPLQPAPPPSNTPTRQNDSTSQPGYKSDPPTQSRWTDEEVQRELKRQEDARERAAVNGRKARAEAAAQQEARLERYKAKMAAEIHGGKPNDTAIFNALQNMLIDAGGTLIDDGWVAQAGVAQRPRDVKVKSCKKLSENQWRCVYQRAAEVRAAPGSEWLYEKGVGAMIADQQWTVVNNAAPVQSTNSFVYDPGSNSWRSPDLSQQAAQAVEQANQDLQRNLQEAAEASRQGTCDHYMSTGDLRRYNANGC